MSEGKGKVPKAEDYLMEMEGRAAKSLPKPGLQMFYEVGPWEHPDTVMWAQTSMMNLRNLAVAIGRAMRQAEYYRREAVFLLALAQAKHKKLPPLLSVEELALLPVEDDWGKEKEEEVPPDVLAMMRGELRGRDEPAAPGPTV